MVSPSYPFKARNTILPFTRRNTPSHQRPARSRALCARRHSAHALLARIWTRFRTRLRREGPVPRSSPRRRGRASCRLFAERKLPADPRGNALLSWRERARAAQQRGRHHPSPGTRERPACPARRGFRVRERTRPVRTRVWGTDGGGGLGVERAWGPGD